MTGILHRMGDTRNAMASAPAPGVRPLADHALLIASVAVRQAGTRTARVAGRLAVREATLDPVHALVATFRHADTVAAARALRGSFHPAVARATTGNPPSTLVNPGFTLAF